MGIKSEVGAEKSTLSEVRLLSSLWRGYKFVFRAIDKTPLLEYVG